MKLVVFLDKVCHVTVGVFVFWYDTDHHEIDATKTALGICSDGENVSNVIDVSGMSKLRFKPAYNPYTEPSMEIFRW